MWVGLVNQVGLGSCASCKVPLGNLAHSEELTRPCNAFFLPSYTLSRRKHSLNNNCSFKYLQHFTEFYPWSSHFIFMSVTQNLFWQKLYQNCILRPNLDNLYKCFIRILSREANYFFLVPFCEFMRSDAGSAPSSLNWTSNTQGETGQLFLSLSNQQSTRHFIQSSLIGFGGINYQLSIPIGPIGGTAGQLTNFTAWDTF